MTRRAPYSRNSAPFFAEVKRRKLSDRQVAALCGISHGTISDLRSGRRHPGESTRERIANGLLLDSERLFPRLREQVTAPSQEEE